MFLYSNSLYLEDLRLCAAQSIGIDLLDNTSILITGASGLIGSFLVDVLSYASYELGLNIRIVAAGRNKAKLNRRFSESPWRPELTEIDVCKVCPLEADIDFVIHAASNSHPESITGDPVGTSLANVIGTWNLLDWARTHNVRRFVLVSSGEIYGQLRERCFTEEMQGYIDPLSLRSCYPLSKRMAENICVAASRRYGVEAVIARLCHTYGPTMTDSDTRAASQFIRLAAKGEQISVNGTGSQVRSWCHVIDAVSGICSIMAIGEPGHAYNISNPKSIASIYDFARVAAAAAGVSVQVLGRPEREDASPITYQVLDSARLMGCGWNPIITVSEGVSRCVDVLRNHESVL